MSAADARTQNRAADARSRELVWPKDPGARQHAALEIEAMILLVEALDEFMAFAPTPRHKKWRPVAEARTALSGVRNGTLTTLPPV